MAFTFDNIGLGDLIVHESEPKVGYCREEITVGSTPAITLPVGSVVFRALAATPGNYAVLSNLSQLVTTNEFAITLGDSLGEVLPLSIAAAGTGNCAAVVRGNIILKDKKVFDVVIANGVALNDTNKANLRHMLKKQGIILEKTI
jgi:hypothetical protein